MRAVVCAALVALGIAGAELLSTQPVAGQETRSGVLSGAAALDRLKQDGQYESLQAAMNQARFNVSRAEQTPLGRAAWHAPNASAGYDAYVTEAGVSIAVNDQSYVSLSLHSIGYGGALQGVAPGQVSGDKQSITLTRDGVREWFVNGPDGLEHGFTLDDPPNGAGARHQGVPLRLAMQVSEGWRAVASDDGKRVTLRGAGDQAVEYGKLVVRDNLGRNIPARLAVADEQVVIEVEDHDATYPLTIDPLFTLQQKLLAADGTAFDYLGHAVALDGNTALVGAPADDTPNSDQGAAYVFVRNGATWTQQQKLIAPDGAASDLFGWSVALNGDTVLVGAVYGPGGANSNQGAAYVFARNGATQPVWTLQKKLTAADGHVNAQFGAAVALVGNTALVGAPEHQIIPNFVNTGAVFIFTRSGTTWTQQARLNANDGEDGDAFGRAVALEGDTALIGAPNNAVTVGGQGAAYVFTRNGASWTQRQRLLPVQPSLDDHFGNAVALSGDTAVIGAYQRNQNNGVSMIPDCGSVYDFRRGAAGWGQVSEFVAPNPTAGAQFGISLALSGDTAVIGASRGLFQPGADQRSAYVFVDLGEWAMVRHLGPELGSANDGFGYAVALDGDTVLVGAYRSDAAATDQGAAYAFVLHDSRHIEQQKLLANDGAESDYFGEAVALDGDTLVVGAQQDDIGANVNQGSVYVFTRNGTVWTFQQKLTANDGAANDFFGKAVAVNGDTLAVGAHADDIGANLNQGSAYIFTRNGTVWTFQQKLMAAGIDGLPGDNFGSSVALSGQTVAIGARGVNVDRGAAYVFTRNGTVWAQQAKLIGNELGNPAYFGAAVALNGDTLVVGAPFDGATRGSTYVFTRSGASWMQQPKLTASDAEMGDYFGHAVAVNGDTLAVGAYNDTIGTKVGQGSAYVFTRFGTAWAFRQKLIANDGAANDHFGYAVALSGSLLVVGARDDTVGANIEQGSAYVFTHLGLWQQQQRLTASDGTATDRFGISVAVSGDTVAVGTGSDDIGTTLNQGSAYVFVSPRCPAITIAPASLPGGVLGVAYNQPLTESGGGAGEYLLSVSSGALPPGLMLSYVPGLLSGTPTAPGTYRFTITATFVLSGCTGSRNYTLTVTAPSPTITINPATLPNGATGAAYNQTLTATGGATPYRYSITAGALPRGLSLSAGGVLGGAPTASGASDFTVTATDANGAVGMRAYTLVINGCSYTLTPANQSFGASAATGNVNVTAGAGCAWTATSNAAWLTITSGANGTGNGQVAYRVATNTGAARQAAVTVAGQTHIVQQAAPRKTPRLTQLTPNAARLGANGFMLTVTGDEFTPSQRVQWNGNNCETGFVSDTQLRVVIPAAWLTREGLATVQVADTANGEQSNPARFRVLGAVAHASAASYDTITLAPDSVVAAFGANLATEARVAESLPLPTELAGTTVTVRDSQGAVIRAPLFFVAPSQVNYLMPPGLADGIATVTITNGRGVAVESLTEISAVAPGLFSASASGEGAAAAVVLRIRANGEQVYEPVARYDAQTQRFVLEPIDLSNPAEQVYLILFGTGFRHHDSLEGVMIKLGETELPVAYAGAAPGLAGVDQVNVLLPASLRGRGEQTITLRINDEVTNSVNAHFQ
jgi:uncharacterized protein (TIGR03437 family)